MMRVLDSLAQTIADLLQADDARVLLGEDVADGGMLGLSRVCLETADLAARLLSTPLVPAAGIAHAAGLAAAGLKPIFILPSAAAIMEGYGALREVVYLHQQGHLPGQMVLLAPYGAGFGLRSRSSDALEAALCALAGLRVVCLGQANQAKALVEAAVNFSVSEQPTVILLPRLLLLQEEVQTDELASSLAHADVLSRGEEATVFAWGAAVEQAKQAIAQSQIKAGLVDVRSLAPLDISTLVNAAQQTGKLVIVQTSHSGYGPGAELAAIFTEHAILQLDAPILRVTCNAENAELSIQEIALAIHQVANY